MKKTILIVSLLVIMLFSAVTPVYAATAHTHRWMTEGYYANTCTRNGEIRQRCITCGKLEVTVLQACHLMTTKVQEEAGYTHKGKMLHYCTRSGCTRQYTSDIPMKDIKKATSTEKKNARKYFGGSNLGYGYDSNTEENVRKVQEALKDLGYNVKVDGKFGTQTRNAIISLEEKYGLGVDNGIVGEKVMVILYYK